MNELEQYISLFFGVSGEDTRTVASYFRESSIKKGDFLLTPGKVCKTLSFQRSGLIRFYVYKGDKEITQWISDKGNFVTDLSGLIFGMPSKFYIHALSDTDFYTISQDDYISISQIIPKWHYLEKLFIARAFIFMEERILSLTAMNAEQRYHWLFNYNSSLFNQVPLQYLASMLGMTPETLSRIRKKYHKTIS